MDNKNRDQQNASSDDQQNLRADQNQDSRQDVSNNQEENPQSGNSWNNYRTREMGNSPDEGNQSLLDKDSGGGSLY